MVELDDDVHGCKWIKCSNLEKKKEKNKNPMKIKAKI
jgi:hypothetical protein